MVKAIRAKAQEGATPKLGRKLVNHHYAEESLSMTVYGMNHFDRTLVDVECG